MTKTPPATPDYGAMADAIVRIAADLRAQARGADADAQLEQAARLERIAAANRKGVTNTADRSP